MSQKTMPPATVLVRMTLRDARRVGDLHEQLRVATGGLPLSDAEPTIRVRLGEGVGVEACELWGRIGHNPNPRWLCHLTAGIGLRLALVEKAAENCGFVFPMSDVRRRAQWRRSQTGGSPTAWFELPLLAPGLDEHDYDRPQRR